jgi:hypothetical protein
VGVAEENGARWGCLSLHRASRFVVAFSAQETEGAAVPEVVRRTRERTAGRRGIRWITDGHPAYHHAVRQVYRDPVRSGRVGRPRLVPTPGAGLTQLCKLREGMRLKAVVVRHRFGPEPEQPHTVRIERKNGVLRDGLGCLTRRTHAFAKRERSFLALVGMRLFEDNWLRPHLALRERIAGLPAGRRYRRRTPAMVLGLTDRVWEWSEFLSRRVCQCK